MNHAVNQRHGLKHDPEAVKSFGGMPPPSPAASASASCTNEGEKPENRPGVRRKSSVVRAAHLASLKIRPSQTLHEDPAFDMDWTTSDDCPNEEFLALLNKAVQRYRYKLRRGRQLNMRGFLNALHGSNLLLQSKTAVYRLITGKGSVPEASSRSIEDADARIFETCVHSARVDPAWMLRYGPAGDLPMHLAFLLGKKRIGQGMLQALETLTDAEQTQYWHCCYGVHAKYPDTVEPVPKERGIPELIAWIINLPYQSDILWWFKEVARRERAGNEGASDLVARFSSFVPHSKVQEVLANDVGLFTGETLIHIAISFRDQELVDWLLERGARLDARALGMFFQPKHIAILSDNSKSKWFWQPQLEDNEHAGCYYGEYPLAFAASIGDVDLATLLIEWASEVIHADDDKATPFLRWLDRRANDLLAESEGFHMSYANGSADEQRSRRLSTFINVQDMHGNTALHMAVMYHHREMVEYIIKNGGGPSLSLMNHDNRTPLTLAVRCPVIFNTIVATGFRETVWQYGDSEMTLVSLYQIDSFRVRPRSSILSSGGLFRSVPSIQRAGSTKREARGAESGAPALGAEPSGAGTPGAPASPPGATDTVVASEEQGSAPAPSRAPKPSLSRSFSSMPRRQASFADALDSYQGREKETEDAAEMWRLRAANEMRPLQDNDLASVSPAKLGNDARSGATEASAAAGEPLQTKSLVADIIGAEDTTLQQRRFMLHAKKGWKSALEIVVEHEIHVLKDVPIFFRLIDAKWKAFGRRYHVTYTVLPYLFFFVCFNTGLLLRCFDIEEAFYNLNADGKPVKPLNLTRTVAAISSSLSSGNDASTVGNQTVSQMALDDLREEAEIALRLALDLIVYLVMMLWLVFKAWKDNRFFSAFVDLDQDLSMSWDEVMLYVYRNISSIMNSIIVILLVTVAAIRLHEHDGWFTLPSVWDQAEEDDEVPTLPTAIANELDVLSMCSVFVWLNLLPLMLPFKRIGILLLSIYSMLVGDVCRWVLIFLVFLMAFALGSYVALVMSTRSITDIFLSTTTSRDISFADVVRQFVYMSAGEVVPGTLSKVARNVDLINTYNITMIVLSTTVLMNLLVALMGSTFIRHSNLGRQMWWLEFSDLVLRYERRLSAKDREVYRTGECVGNPGNDGLCEYYLVSMSRTSGDEDKHAHLYQEHEVGNEADNEDNTDKTMLHEGFQEMQKRMAALERHVLALTSLLAPGKSSEQASIIMKKKELRRSWTHHGGDHMRNVNPVADVGVGDASRGYGQGADIDQHGKAAASRADQEGQHMNLSSPENVQVRLNPSLAAGEPESPGEAGGAYVVSPIPSSATPVSRRRARKEAASSVPISNGNDHQINGPEDAESKEDGKDDMGVKSRRRRERASLRKAASDLVEHVATR